MRLIARLDIKGENLIKGIQMEGLRVIGDPKIFANDYYDQGIDEILFIDTVASLYGRNQLSDLISSTSKNIFVPMTVGGGIRSILDVEKALRAGADKIAINTAAVNNPNLISEIATNFGSQCIVVSIEAKKMNNRVWEVYTNNGREKTGINMVDWVKKSIDYGAGEILLTSVDMDGTKKGFDLDLVELASNIITVPLVVSGGAGNISDIAAVSGFDKVDGIAIGTMLHQKKSSVQEIKGEMISLGRQVRI